MICGGGSFARPRAAAAWGRKRAHRHTRARRCCTSWGARRTRAARHRTAYVQILTQIACLEQLTHAARDASLARDAADLLRDAYGALFAALDCADVRYVGPAHNSTPLCTLLVLLTERRHVRAFRVRKVCVCPPLTQPRAVRRLEP